METPVTFRNEGQQLVGMLHLPDAAKAAPAVAFFHGFTGTHIEPHRLFVHTARALASEGMVVLRFDFRGSGDSEGEFQEMTVEQEVSDGLVALNFLRGRKEVDGARLGVLGLSLGGVIGMHVAARLEEEGRPLLSLALWAAPAQGRDLVAARTDPAAIESVRKFGYADRMGNAVGRRFIEEYEAMEQRKELRKSECSVLIVHGTADASVPVEHANWLEESASKMGRLVEKVILADADHTFNRLDWQRAVIEKTAGWFVKTL